MSSQTATTYGSLSIQGAASESVVPEEVVEAIREFIKSRKTGSVVVQFKNGGIAGVETYTKRILK